MTDQTAARRRRRRRRASPLLPPPASPLEVDDLLREILLRVPPQPSALPRASLVCKRWRRVVTDPRFLRCFCAHHRKAPLVGYFEQRFGERAIVFSPVLEPPDRIPPRRFFSLGRAVAGAGPEINFIHLLDCRHGRVAIIDMSDKDFTLFVCDTVTGGLERLAVPPQFRCISVKLAQPLLVDSMDMK
ncbi:hypothetical protein U9M48_001601 [Paspalum notatum var. saurae]|uniref:F-box domain-containing protein n=1 Tax=Paspalum notatum var. saurae TaxID=547442 RepID=A0AAQ3SFC3_PASNO